MPGMVNLQESLMLTILIAYTVLLGVPCVGYLAGRVIYRVLWGPAR